MGNLNLLFSPSHFFLPLSLSLSPTLCHILPRFLSLSLSIFFALFSSSSSKLSLSPSPTISPSLHLFSLPLSPNLFPAFPLSLSLSLSLSLPKFSPPCLSFSRPPFPSHTHSTSIALPGTFSNAGLHPEIMKEAPPRRRGKRPTLVSLQRKF